MTTCSCSGQTSVTRPLAHPLRKPLPVFLSPQEGTFQPVQRSSWAPWVVRVLAAKPRLKANLGGEPEKELMKFNQMPEGNT